MRQRLSETLQAVATDALGRREAPVEALAEDAEQVARACHEMAVRFHRGGKLVVFGSGGPSTDAQHVAVEFVHPVIVGKRALPALTRDLSASNALRLGTEEVLRAVSDQTDIVLDVSSLPRIAYLSLMLALLDRLVPNRNAPVPLAASKINLQILVGEDAGLDSMIQSEDPSNELVLIPGFASALQTESTRDWPLVWFPVLGENRVSQLQKVMYDQIPDSAEICPVLPHPSRDPRRASRPARLRT